jgi:hypothetical protein
VATESVDLKVTLDVRQAQQALDQVRNSAKQLGGEKESLNKQLMAFKEKTEKNAAAIAILTTAMGQQTSAAGKLVQGVGTLAAAYAAGGPFGVALAFAIPAVNALSSAFNDFQASHQSYALSFDAIGKAAKLSHDTALAPMLSTLESLRKELRTLGMDSIQAAYTEAEAIVGAKRRERDRVTAERRAVQGGSYTPSTAKMTGDERSQYLGSLIRRQAAAEEAVRIAEAKLSEITTTAEAIYAGKRGGGSGVEESKDDPAAKEEEALRNMLKVEYGLRVEANKRNYDLLLSRLSSEAEAHKAFTDELAEYEMANEAELSRYREQQRKASDAADLARIQEQAKAIGQVASMVGQLAGDVIAGHEDAFERFISSAAQAAGGFIVLEGGKAIAEGLLAATNPFTAPMAPGMLAVGAGLVAAGTAIQVAGPSAVSALTGAGRGASGGGGGDGSASRTRGVGGGSRASGGGGGGGTVINITYGGISGPSADDGARALTKATRRAYNRGMVQRTDRVLP